MTAPRMPAAPSRITDAARDVLAREIADQIIHEIGHTSGGIQVYADMVDAVAVAVRVVRHLRTEVADVVLSLCEVQPSPTELARLLSTVGSVSPSWVREQRDEAQRLRDAYEQAQTRCAAPVEPGNDGLARDGAEAA